MASRIETAPSDDGGSPGAMPNDRRGRSSFRGNSLHREEPHGSYNSDDEGQPHWNRTTKLLAEYTYRDENGQELYRKLKGKRADGEKVFLTARLLKGNDLQIAKMEQPRDFYRLEGLTNYLKGDGGLPAVLYRLDEYLADCASRPDETVFICEGEKDADTLHSHGLIATTNPNGAGKFLPAFAKYFADRNVVIVPDNDERGRQHAVNVASTISGVARSIRVISLPNLPEKEDVTFWLENGHTAADLLELVREAEDWVAGGNGGSGASRAPSPTERGDGDEPHSQITMANAWRDRHGHARAFNHTNARWHCCDPSSGIWLPDEERAVFNEIAGVVHAEGEGTARYSNAGFIRGTETLAAAMPGIACTHEAFDTDPMVIGTPTGPVDLKTGQGLQPDPKLMLTKATSISPAQGEPTKWLHFLSQSTGGDQEMIEFLQRVVGYMLTGLTIEQSLFFIYGDGGNGKGVFVNTISNIMGDYAVTSAMETFTASRNERHSTELAMLNGARAVMASETEKGRAWAESRIKQLTGGDKITARFMRQDNFTFAPQFKLLIIGNFHPVLNTVDDAMRRRFNIIPFTRKPEVVNKRLEQELEAEFPQILNWMIEGCLKWQEGGLQRPQAVVDATADYFEEQDLFGQWLEEFCDLEPGAAAYTKDLFHSWSAFAAEAKEDAGSIKGFGSMMTKRGFAPGRDSKGSRLRFWKGVKLMMVRDPATGAERVKTPRDSVGEAI